MEFSAGLMAFSAGLMAFSTPNWRIFEFFLGIFGELSGGGPGAAAPDLPPLWAPDPGLRPARDT